MLDVESDGDICDTYMAYKGTILKINAFIGILCFRLNLDNNLQNVLLNY